MAVDSGTMTPADVERRRKFAESLLSQGMSTDPVGHPLAAVARALQGGIGGYVSGKAERDSAQERARSMQQLQGLIGGSASGQPADMAKILTTASDPWLGQGGSMVAGKLLESQLPGKPPNSMREFELARSNPAYAQFLDRRSPQVNIKNMGTIPPGYQVEYDGQGRPVKMSPIPGSPDAQKAEAAKKAEEVAGGQKQATANIVIDAIDRADKMIESNPALTAGVGGALLSKLPGTDANNVRALIDTVKANAGFDRLQQMRDSSPTGGALGQVSEREIAYLQSTIGNLEQSQTVGQLRENMKKVREAYSQIIHGPSGSGGRDDGWQTLPNGVKIREKK